MYRQILFWACWLSSSVEFLDKGLSSLKKIYLCQPTVVFINIDLRPHQIPLFNSLIKIYL